MHTRVRLLDFPRPVAMELRMKQDASGRAVLGNVALQAQPERTDLEKTEGPYLICQQGNDFVIKSKR